MTILIGELGKLRLQELAGSTKMMGNSLIQ
jgi:hypothetical protein